MSSPRAVIAVDLGKSRCRMVIADPRRRPVHDGIGAPGLAADGGIDAAVTAILPLAERIDAPFAAVAVGAAGAWTAPDAASELAERLTVAMGAPVVVTSDVVSAHVGALRGDEGTLLVVGTGAAALGIDDGGALLVDGWGPELGDFGSGSWFGREALRAVLRASVGQVPSTVLTDAVSMRIGDAATIHSWLAQDDPLPRRLATLAPLVLDAAQGGDGVADEIVTDGVRRLVESTVTASPRTRRVALHGGLTEHPWFRARLERELRAAGREPVASRGDALDGALLLAGRADLPHERFAHRAE